jgi:hypothetical protein
VLDRRFWRDWRDAPASYDERPPPLAWLAAGALALVGLREIVAHGGGLAGALVHPGTVAAFLGAAALFGVWIRGGAWRLCLVVGLDLVASAGLFAHAVALVPSRDVAARWVAALLTLQLLPGVFLHLRTWTVLVSAWGLQRACAREASHLRAVLSGPPTGRDVVFVARSVVDGDAEGDLRDGGGTRPGVIRAGLLSDRLATLVAERPASFLLGGVVVRDELEPSDGYRQQRSRSRVVERASVGYLGADPEAATHATSYAEDILAAAAVLIGQHVVLFVLAGCLLALPWWSV